MHRGPSPPAPAARSLSAGGCRPTCRPLRSPDDVQVGETDEHRLAPDRRVLERDRDLFVAAGQLAGDDDAVAPAGVANAIAVAELALAGDDRPGRLRPRGCA